jgi:hypothetical protein
VYSLDTAGPALPTPQMTHPTASWRWTAFCDGPGGILACGYAGLQSAVYSGSPSRRQRCAGAGRRRGPLLSMPAGERMLSSLYYMGSLLVLGTNRGVRVCEFNSYYGSVTLGPLTVLTESAGYRLGGLRPLRLRGQPG